MRKIVRGWGTETNSSLSNQGTGMKSAPNVGEGEAGSVAVAAEAPSFCCFGGGGDGGELGVAAAAAA